MAYVLKHGVLRPHGVATVDAPGAARPVQTDHLQCCHCGGHFPVVRGSGKRRGFCTLCNRVTCGAPGCDPCVPFEKRLLAVERAAGLTC